MGIESSTEKSEDDSSEDYSDSPGTSILTSSSISDESDLENSRYTNSNEVDEKLQERNGRLRNLYSRLGDLYSYYQKVCLDSDLAFLDNDFPFQNLIDETENLIEELEAKKRELGKAIRQNPRAREGKRVSEGWKEWEWPRLEGCKFEVAKAQILKDAPEYRVWRIRPGEVCHEVFLKKCVRIFVDENDIVARAPEEG